MGRLAALGIDPSPLLTQPVWTVPLWQGVLKLAEARRVEWSRIDAVHVINALGEAM